MLGKRQNSIKLKVYTNNSGTAIYQKLIISSMINIEEFEEKNGVAMGTQKQKHNQLFNYIKPELHFKASSNIFKHST